MKRILSLLTLALLLGGPAAAQDWGELLKQTLTNAADKATDGKLTQYALPGTWSYSSPGVRFEGDDAAADLGAQLLSAALSDQLGKIYAKVGLTPGTGSITFDREGKFTAALGEKQLTGDYAYDAETHVVSVSSTHEKFQKFGTVSGRAYIDGSALQLLIPATKLLEIVQSVSAQSESLVGPAGQLPEPLHRLLVHTQGVDRRGRPTLRSGQAGGNSEKKRRGISFCGIFPKKIFMTDSRRIRHFSLRFDAERQ